MSGLCVNLYVCVCVFDAVEGATAPRCRTKEHVRRMYARRVNLFAFVCLCAYVMQVQTCIFVCVHLFACNTIFLYVCVCICTTLSPLSLSLYVSTRMTYVHMHII